MLPSMMLRLHLKKKSFGDDKYAILESWWSMVSQVVQVSSDH